MQTEEKNNLKKSLFLYFCFLFFFISVASQIVHCIIFYKSRSLFLHIIEGSKTDLLHNIKSYLYMFCFLLIYGLIIKILHGKVLSYIFRKQKTILLFDGVLLGWKYFYILLFFLIKMIYLIPWSLGLYICFIKIILWSKKNKLIILSIYTFIAGLYLISFFYCTSYFKSIHSMCMLMFSIIYITIFPCLDTIKKIKKLSG